MKKILITGGCGYVGSRLVPYLLSRGYDIRVLDSLVFGNSLSSFNFELIQGDIRDENMVRQAVKDVDVVIHLAAISNDPTAELSPNITKEVNYDAVRTILESAKSAGVRKVILASSSTLYGYQGEDVILKESDACDPLTLYGKYKAESEQMGFAMADDHFTVTAARPGTVAGFSVRQRFDLIVNIFTNHAYSNKKIIIEGGKQKRPIIHIEDMCRAYEALLVAPAEKINRQAFNIVGANMTVEQIGKMVAEIVPSVVVEYVDKSDDRRSYFTSGEKIEKVLGFKPKYTVEEAVRELLVKFEEDHFKDSMNNSIYFNIKTLKTA